MSVLQLCMFACSKQSRVWYCKTPYKNICHVTDKDNELVKSHVMEITEQKINIHYITAGKNTLLKINKRNALNTLRCQCGWGTIFDIYWYGLGNVQFKIQIQKTLLFVLGTMEMKMTNLHRAPPTSGTGHDWAPRTVSGATWWCQMNIMS